MKSMNVVMVIMVMGIAGGTVVSSSSYNTQPELQRLREKIDSHTESLRNINWYLKQTDVFWVWFQENKGRLDEILSVDHTSPPTDHDRLLQRLEDLERKEKERDKQVQQMQNDLTAERQKTIRLENRLQEIPALNEKIVHLEAQLRMVNQTTHENQRDIDGMTADIDKVRQQIEVNNNRLERERERHSTSGKRLSKQDRYAGLERQINTLHTSVAGIQSNISNLDGRINGLLGINHQYYQLQEEHSELRDTISRMEKSSNATNEKIKETIVHVDELNKKVVDLEQRTQNASYYNRRDNYDVYDYEGYVA